MLITRRRRRDALSNRRFDLMHECKIKTQRLCSVWSVAVLVLTTVKSMASMGRCIDLRQWRPGLQIQRLWVYASTK